MVKLGEIADIQIGFQSRERRRSNTARKDGSHWIIQTKDVDSEGNLLTNQLSKINPAGKIDRYLVTKDIVLFLSRGQNNIAITIHEPIQNTLASYYFYILRANLKHVLPEYLAWFINQPSAQGYFESAGQGSLVKMVPKSTFEELEIQVPSLETQRAIVQLDTLRKKEAVIMERLIRSRKRLINGLALKAATKESQVQ